MTLFAGPAAATEALVYTLTPDPATHTLGVHLEWSAGDRTQSHLAIAESWAYVRSPARFIHDVTAVAGSAIEQTPGSDQHWSVRHEPNSSVSIEYVVNTGHTSFDWSRHYFPVVWRSFFHGIGHTFLITPDPDVCGGEPFDVTIRWELPGDWPHAVCSLGVGEAAVRAPVHDIRHAVYLAGKLDLVTTEVSGARVTVALHNLFSFDMNEFRDLASRIVEAEIAFMEERDFPDFVITAIPVGDPPANGSFHRGGTGLFRSFALFLPPMSRLDDDIAFLFAHELFHYWNGRVLNREMPEELVYWISEGFTDYYAFRILLESFPEMRGSLAQRLNRQIARYVRSDAIHATNDDVRQRFWTSPETFGQLPYQRGMFLAIRWHHLARERGIEQGLDLLFKTAVTRGRDDGYRLSNESFRAMGIETLGAWFGEDFDRFVDGREIVEVAAEALQPFFTSEAIAEYPYDLGFDFDRSREDGVVRGLRDGSAAANAGLREGDKLTGWSVRPGEANSEVVFNVQRGGMSETIRFLPRGEAFQITHFLPCQDD